MKTRLILALGLLLTAAGVSNFFKSDASTKTPAAAAAETALSRPSPIFEAVQTTVKCDTTAYLTDQDPNGTNVRSKPDKNSAIVKTLGSADAIVVRISRSSKGWFGISSAETAGGETDKTLFKGRGWIHSSLVGLDVASGDPKLYAEPRKRSRVLQKLIPDGSQIKPIGCKGGWMQVLSGKITGWIPPEAQCANPLTTCA